MTILRSVGKDYPTNVLQKRVRDTVSFKDARKPWRRSPFYLVIRVAIQRHLYRLLGAEIGALYFKVIMCELVSYMMSSSIDIIPQEGTFALKQKLGRRLAKLETDYRSSALHKTLFETLDPEFQWCLSKTGDYLKNRWENFRGNTQRVIRPLPYFAADTDFCFRLPVSGSHLNRLLARENNGDLPNPGITMQRLTDYEISASNAKPIRTIIDHHFKLAKSKKTKPLPVNESSSSLELDCLTLANQIIDRIQEAGDAYDGYSNLKSKFILDILELWIDMDRLATRCEPSLKDYHPAIDPECMNSLELLRLFDLRRVHTIEKYLLDRVKLARHDSITIYDNPSEKTFGVVYFNHSPDLQELRERINNDAKVAREVKEEEWNRKTEEHERLIQLMAESTCPYAYEMDDDGVYRKKHQKGCQKHKYKWQAKQIKIEVFENPLPESDILSKTAVFELLCPSTFSAYRDSTWLIIATFALAKKTPIEKVSTLGNYRGLQSYSNRNPDLVTLGSATKSHYDCHYNELNFPVPLDTVCPPCGLNYQYFDQGTQNWILDFRLTSFAANFDLALPSNSPYLSLSLSNKDWPSSNEILASQTKCPSNLNIHEFMAWQGLMSGIHSRWLCLLRELGSTNINFSSESVWAMVRKVILQTGPCQIEDERRDIHSVFRDSAFCTQLLEQVRYRIHVIYGNWRENLQMDTLISILLKVVSLSSHHSVRTSARELLGVCRDATRKWCQTLQKLNDNGSNFVRLSALWAAVLCKRTHLGFDDLNASLECFLYASITLQENLSGEFDSLPHSLRNVLLDDASVTYNSRHHLRKFIMDNQQALRSSVSEFFSISPESSITTAEALSGGWWVQLSITPTETNDTCFIHYNIIHGDLLINGEPSGSLPMEYRKFSIILRVFGTWNLRVYPSNARDMSLSVQGRMPYGHNVHLGLRQGNLIIRAKKGTSMLELVNPDMFCKDKERDFPAALVDDCWHWLDLRTGIMEIRQEEIWRSKHTNWRLNVRKRLVFRKQLKLVDPNSVLASQVAQNFRYFEDAKNITVWQPSRESYHIEVELRRLELNFHVNNDHLLECRQLEAEIVSSQFQDAGVWYGLKSKIVLQSVVNRRQRIILIPPGDFFPKKDQYYDHVITTIRRGEGSYRKFVINDVLGRVECPAEPELLYLKAMCHAYTSHFLPDPLTGRTGKAEALSFLTSGLCMPWTCLDPVITSRLLALAKLTPRRVYYPPTSSCMETVYWNPNLTTTIQDDRYRSVIEKIYQRSSDLKLFETNSSEGVQLSFPTGITHLETRAIALSGLQPTGNIDDIYRSRDGYISNARSDNAAEVSSLLRSWPAKLSNTKDVIAILRGHKWIQGYHVQFDYLQISTLVGIDLAKNWGSLARSAIQSRPPDRYRLMFLFGPISFSKNTDMQLVRVLLSFAFLPELKSIALPSWESYDGFKPSEAPTVSGLANLMRAAHKPYVRKTGRYRKDQLAAEQRGHNEKVLEACEKLAESIKMQWPKAEVDLATLAYVDESLLDTKAALRIGKKEYTRMAHNLALAEHLEEVQYILDENDGGIISPFTITEPRFVNKLESSYPARNRSHDLVTLRTLLGNCTIYGLDKKKIGGQPPATLAEIANSELDKSDTQEDHMLEQYDAPKQKSSEQNSDIKALREIVKNFQDSSVLTQQIYGSELDKSITSLVELNDQPSVDVPVYNSSEIETEIKQAEQNCRIMYYNIIQALDVTDRRATWLKYAGLWPDVTKLSLFAQLNSSLETSFGGCMKEALVQYGTEITALQRLLRIEDAEKQGKHQQRVNEQVNSGHDNWCPLNYTDWLLLEIDSNIMLRPEQVDVAKATISPSSGRNSVVQLLMGKGKTSCILPMVALMLANQHLLRIVVPRSLLLQSAQQIQLKLGSLLNREIIHIPFSRRTPTNESSMGKFADMHTNVRESKGVMLALPEHILSFRLSGIQRLCDSRKKEGAAMVNFQSWLDHNARDVLDECDVSLAIRTQLIYPSGSQMLVDGHPLRWQVVQNLLRLVLQHIRKLMTRFPRSIEVVHRAHGTYDQGVYPLIYFLRDDIQDYLIQGLVDDIVQGRFHFLPSGEIPPRSQADIRDFISNVDVSSAVMKRLEKIYRDKQHLMKVLFHVRGLFVHRILLTTLRKRWNVQYGLHPDRVPVAVPYLVSQD